MPSADTPQPPSEDQTPAAVEALTALGEVLLEAGQAARAAVFAERALRLAPSDARAQALVAKVKERRSP